jgi:hypothetical protein
MCRVFPATEADAGQSKVRKEMVESRANLLESSGPSGKARRFRFSLLTRAQVRAAALALVFQVAGSFCLTRSARGHALDAIGKSPSRVNRQVTQPCGQLPISLNV